MRSMAGSTLMQFDSCETGAPRLCCSSDGSATVYLPGCSTFGRRGIRRRGTPPRRRRAGRVRPLGPLVLDLAVGGETPRVPRGGADAIPGRERVDASYPTRLRADAVRASNAVRAPHRRLVLRAPGIWRAPDADASAARVGDSFYSLGPALALVLVDGQVFFMGRVASVPARPSWPRSSSTPPQG
jgi:hypothetical protein